MSVCVSVRAHARISVCALFWYVVLQLNGRTYDDSIVDCTVIVRSCAWKQEFYVLGVHVVRENAQISPQRKASYLRIKRKGMSGTSKAVGSMSCSVTIPVLDSDRSPQNRARKNWLPAARTDL